MYGVLTPQHLNRLGLINDSLLYTYSNDEDNTTEKGSKNEKDNKKEDSEKLKIYNEKQATLLNDLANNKNYTKYNEIIEEFKADNPELFKLHEVYDEDIFKDPPKLFEDKDVTTDTIILLKQALNKIPQIPFSLLLDEYRWKYFEGNLKGGNQEFWDMALDMQGIAPPGFRGEEYFDVGAKFHVPDNTPFIRYFCQLTYYNVKQNSTRPEKL